VATEVRTGYTRDKFHLWIDADGDGCNTRNEVLIAEATTKPSVGARCALTGGRWLSYYDNATWTLASDLDIDHLVPLAEAWDSGADSWTTSRRQSFANDLTRPQLIAVTDNVNQAKGDQTPATWKPPLTSFWCTYAKMWVHTKSRFALTINSAEKSALTDMLNRC
jgi:Protein of unknown function (DUF1524)